MNSKQRAYLRSLANNIDSIFQIGKNGITDVYIKQINDALDSRELIKITVLSSSQEDNVANTIAEKTNSEVVQYIGNKITLFRAKEKDSKIVFPK